MLNKIIKLDHFYYICFIVLIVFLLSGPILNLNNSRRNGDWRNSDTPGYHFLKQYIIEDKSWPLWDHMTFSGRPLFGFGMPLLYPPTILLSLFFNPYITLNLMMIIHLILSGIGMYFLSYEILKNKKSSLISSLIYLLSPYLVISSLSHPFWVYGLSFIPLELFLAIRAFKRKNFIFYSVLLGITGGLHFLSSGILQWYYAMGFILFYLFFKIFRKNWKTRLIKSFFISIIFISLTSSLIAVRFLPGNEWTSFTNRGEGLPIEEIKRVGHVETGDLIDTFILTVNPESKSGRNKYGQIGLFGFLIMSFGIYYYLKNRDYKSKDKDIIIFLLLTMFFVYLFASGIFLEYIYNFPGIKTQRGLDRSLIIYVVCASLIVGLGAKYLFQILEKKKYSTKKIKTVFLILSLLIIGNLLFISKDAISSFYGSFEHYSITESNPILLRISNDNDIFRFHVNEVVGIDWNNFLGASIPLQVESIYGTYGGGWDSRYFNTFLASTFRDPPKLWGMLNVKYIISSGELNNTDYKFIEKFDDIPLDTISNKNYNNTAYLYKNKKFLPRAFFVPISVLVVGQEDYANQLMYAVLVNPYFDPDKIAIIQGKGTIDLYSSTELGKYDAVLLTKGSLTQNSEHILKSYKQKGGIIIPDVLEGENTLSDENINDLFSALYKENKTLKEVEIISYYDKTPNFMKVRLNNNESGFLSISEKYTLYPGWNAKIDNKEAEILLSNGVLSAVYIPKDSEYITFKYYPKSFRSGLMITSCALILVFIYFGYIIYKRIKNVKQKTS
jgi:hypothetical protein